MAKRTRSHASMAEFRELYVNKQKQEWQHHYLQYDKALVLISNIEDMLINAQRDFVDFLGRKIHLVPFFVFSFVLISIFDVSFHSS